MKNHPFYQYIKTRKGESSSIGILAEHISKDAMFPKYSTEYSEITEYLENNPYEHMPLSHFDTAFDDYLNWLKH